MPTYVYETCEGEKGCPYCYRGFEMQHGMAEPPPEACPRCGCKVVRRFTPPALNLRYNEKSTLSDANLKRHGFKKLRNEGAGKFRIT